MPRKPKLLSPPKMIIEVDFTTETLLTRIAEAYSTITGENISAEIVARGVWKRGVEAERLRAIEDLKAYKAQQAAQAAQVEAEKTAEAQRQESEARASWPVPQE